MKQLENKVAIVTGAGQGIGKATALRLASEGVDIVIAEFNPQSAKITAAEVEALGRQAFAYTIDISQTHKIRHMVKDVVERFKQIDILVNNAGICEVRPFLEMTEDAWDRIMRVNQRGSFFCLQEVSSQMLRQVPDSVKETGRADTSYGKIVNLTSISGQAGRPLSPHYAASKASIINITQSAALALAPYGINVNAVSPGVVQTPMWDKLDQERGQLTGEKPGNSMAAFIETVPLKRAATPEDIAAAICFLCSSESDMITGITLNVDGGYEMH